MRIPIWARRSLLTAAIAVCANTVQASETPDILVNHDGLYSGVQDTSGPAGGTFTYRAKVKHNAGDDATGVVLTEVLPVGAIYLSRSSEPTGISCSPSLTSGTVLTNTNNTFTCNVGDLSSADGFKWVDFNVILPTVGSTWTATASAALPAPYGTADGDGGINNVNLTRNFTTNDATDFGIKLTSDAPVGGVNNGETYNYTIDVSSYGPSTLPAGGFARVTFQVPSGAPVTSSDSIGGTSWTCLPANGPVAANGIITCDYPNPPTGSYGAGEPLPPITVPVQSQMGGPIGAAVSVEGFDSTSTPWADGQKGNNTDSLIVQSTGADYTDVSLTKTASPSQLDTNATSTVTYTLQARRESGALQPEQIVVTDTLPAGVSFVAFDTANSADWNCAQSSGTITCNWAPGGVVGNPYTGANNTNLPAIKFTASVPGQASGNAITNEGTITVAPGTEPNTANNKGSATVTFNNTAQLSLNKSGPQRPVKKGELFQYTLTITNDGPMPIAANAPISITDTPSAGLKLVKVNADSSPNWTCPVPPASVAGGAVTCENSSALAVGDSITLVLDARVDTITSDYAVFSNSAATGKVPGRDGDVVSSSANVTVSDQSGDLEVHKTVVTAPANPKSGDAITYRISVTNKAGSSMQTAQAIKITDVLSNLVVADDGAEGNYPNGGFVSAEASGAMPAYSAGAGYPAGTTTVNCPAPTGNANSRDRTLTCTVDYLAVGATVSVDVTIRPRTVTAAPQATSPMLYTNTASAFSPYINDPTPADNTDGESIQMTTLVDLTVDKQVSPTTQVAAGQPATYTVTVKNQGPSSAQAVKMVDTLPVNAILVGEPTVPSGGVCEHSSGPGAMNGQQGGTMTCTWDTPLPAQTQYVVTYKARSVGGNPAPGAKMDNRVHVSTNTEETDYTNNDAEVSIALKPAELDVQIQMSHNDDGLIEGEEVEYTITIKNDNSSSSYATDVVMTDIFPAAGSTATFSYVAGSLQLAGVTTSKSGYVSGVTASMDAALCGTQPNAGDTSGTLQCTIPLMAPGDTVNIKFKMKAEALPAGRTNGTIFHEATVKPAETEFMPGYDALANNDTTDRTSTSNRTSRPGTDVALEKEGPTGFPRAGETVMYTITVFNYGTSASPAGSMADTLPTGLEFVKAERDGNDITSACTQSGNTVTCDLPALSKGGNAVYTIETKVEDPFTGSYPLINKAKAVVAGDEDPTNDEDETSTQPPSTPVPVDNPLALLALILGMGWIARRFHMRKHA